MTAAQRRRRDALESTLGRPDPKALESGVVELLRPLLSRWADESGDRDPDRPRESGAFSKRRQGALERRAVLSPIFRPRPMCYHVLEVADLWVGDMGRGKATGGGGGAPAANDQKWGITMTCWYDRTSIDRLLFLCGLGLLSGCSSNDHPTEPTDTTPPSAVTTLAVESTTQVSATLTWTAVGDDGNDGTATAYDLRYSTAEITAGNVASATQVTGETAPKAAGQGETFTVTGLAAGTTYHFALQVSDEVPNRSALSNVPSRATQGVPPPPQPTVTSLLPLRTVIGDTLVVHGTQFGAEQGSSVVLFVGSGGPVEGVIVPQGWGDTSIRVLVPVGVLDGPVVVRRGSVTGTGVSFQVAPRIVSFTNDLEPLFELRGCASCHGGTNGLFLGSRASLLQGNSVHGPVVIRRDGPGSVIVQKVRGTAGFGVRMPQGSAPLAESEILLISDWIDQGTRDN